MRIAPLHSCRQAMEKAEAEEEVAKGDEVFNTCSRLTHLASFILRDGILAMSVRQFLD